MAKRPIQPIFSKGKITLQSILFCQQVFSAAVIAKLATTTLTDAKRNQLIPVPHPELKTDWPVTLSDTLSNLLLLHKLIPMWVFKSRLNFMSHGPILKYLFYAGKAMRINNAVKRAAKRMDQIRQA